MTLKTPARRVGATVSAMLAAALIAGCSTATIDETARWSAERLYAEAREESAAGNYERAGRLYERLEGRAAGTVLAQQAQLERAYMLYKTGEKAQALAVLERFIKLHPTSPALDYALYLQGLVNFNDNLGLLGSLARQDLSERDQQASRDSYQAFKQLAERFPDSTYAEDARVRMTYIVNSLAAYEVHVARYYYRRGAYVAAANRAQQAVQEFQHSPATEEALFIMVQSYEKLGLNELRDDADRVLHRNFPNTTLYRDGIEGRQRSWWQVW
ncbi:outer membrane protein assembly factor BamD [Piscinibacter koreensis]|uniref:Outer membrane protein assembly factor BamD n=1 Tax=Piscinibacter koreensis TaxID=2742824 RepID=A0A7Y6TWK9_9BURK|nr:outer membrane protein assembly factor BamD [Schlegelella koreensis]NUZ06185.1 outer membrane protein assembly factor BamD [Schlegelella koreensis]